MKTGTAAGCPFFCLGGVVSPAHVSKAGIATCACQTTRKMRSGGPPFIEMCLGCARRTRGVTSTAFKSVTNEFNVPMAFIRQFAGPTLQLVTTNTAVHYDPPEQLELLAAAHQERHFARVSRPNSFLFSVGQRITTVRQIRWPTVALFFSWPYV